MFVRPLFFWDVMQCRLLVCYRLTSCLKTLVTNYQTTPQCPTRV